MSQMNPILENAMHLPRKILRRKQMITVIGLTNRQKLVELPESQEVSIIASSAIIASSETGQAPLSCRMIVNFLDGLFPFLLMSFDTFIAVMARTSTSSTATSLSPTRTLSTIGLVSLTA